MWSSSVIVGLAALSACVLTAPTPRAAADDFDGKVAQGLRLLSLEEDAEPVWKTPEERTELLRGGARFFDITDVFKAEEQSRTLPAPERASYPSGPQHNSEVNALIAKLDTSKMTADLSKLTAFNNRYYNASTGVQAADYVLNTVKTIANGRSDITVKHFSHSFIMPSTIAHIAGKNDSAPITIIGAHLDSINLNNEQTGRAPGADDDGSGSVNLIDIFRVLVGGGFKPSTPVEFHWYAGEEEGLLGSQDIANNYKNAGKQVRAMVELDMTAYFQPGTKEVIAFVDDRTDAGLNTYLRTLVAAYCKIPAGADHCGYACSDNASWNKLGYPASFPFEAPTGSDNQQIHGPGDTTSVQGFSWTHSLEFAKLGLAYIYELAV